MVCDSFHLSKIVSIITSEHVRHAYLKKFDHTVIWSCIWLHEYVHVIFMNKNCLQDLMIERIVCLLEGTCI